MWENVDFISYMASCNLENSGLLSVDFIKSNNFHKIWQILLITRSRYFWLADFELPSISLMYFQFQVEDIIIIRD